MEIAGIIRNRWSPRAFTEEKMNRDEVRSLFEAARWAPSSMNEQPWKYYFALREDSDKFKKFLDCLVPFNQQWAKNASLLILSTAKKHFVYKNKPNRHAMHDTGAANSFICLQANELGYQAHQMGGFKSGETYSAFNIDENEYELVSFIAVGKTGHPSILPEDLRKSELSPRERKNIEEIVDGIIV